MWHSIQLTDDDEGIVDVDATKAVGGFADVGPRVICLHLLDLQAHAEDTETDPAAVDVAPVFGPHYEGRRVSFHWTRQLNGTSKSGWLPVSNLRWNPWRSWEHTYTKIIHFLEAKYQPEAKYRRLFIEQVQTGSVVRELFLLCVFCPA